MTDIVLQRIEKELPDSAGWEWVEGARYRLKFAGNDVWYGVQLVFKDDEVKKSPVIVVWKLPILKIIKRPDPATTLEELEREAKVEAQARTPYIPGKKL